jgi:hypothetical protein
MNVNLKRTALIVSVFCVAGVYLSASDEGKVDQLPALDDSTTKGLVMKAKPVRPTFKVGEHVKIICTITNNSDSVKPLGWWDKGLHFTCLRGEEGGVLCGVSPCSYPEIPEPIQIRSKPLPRPGYILYVPPHESLTFHLSHKAEKPERFRGRMLYDPLAPRAGVECITGNASSKPRIGDLRQPLSSLKQSRLISGVFEYEIVERPKPRSN